MAAWEEVKRLAADFQRAQLSTTIQSLSERNCIEIVTRLVNLKLLDVIYTVDGKEYLTHNELVKEIREELQVHGGRINVVDLQQILAVNLSHIEAKVSEIVKCDPGCVLVLGQLIDRSYLDQISDEINEKLQDDGQVSIGKISVNYNLPASFIKDVICQRLGSIIYGKLDNSDGDTIFTDAFVARHKSRIHGFFGSCTRPTTVSHCLHKYKLQDRLFFNILEELISSKQLKGALTGGRQEKAIYTPDIYLETQNTWIESYYQQNGMLEYDTMSRLGISDGKSFIKKRLKGESLVFLSSCCVGKAIIDQIEGSIDEALRLSSWIDVKPLLPSSLSVKDVCQLLNQVMKSKKGATVFCDTIVASDKFVADKRKPFEDNMVAVAEKAVQKNPSLLAQEDKKNTKLNFEDSKEDKKEQRRKKAAGGAKGGGTQGRESKTKSTKKKDKRNRDDDEDDFEDTPSHSSHSVEVPYMTMEDLESKLKKNLPPECPECFILELTESFHRPLTKKYQDVVRTVFSQMTGSGTGASRKKNFGELQEKITGLWTNVKLFEKGIKLFNDDVQIQLGKHLLKTLCSDITNLAFTTMAVENMVTVTNEADMTNEARIKLLSKLPEDIRGPLTKLNSSLNEKNIDPFLDALEEICGPGKLEINLRKIDKKKERQLIFNHRQSLVEQLQNEEDSAMAFHLAVVIVFQSATSCMVHAPGRCVPQIVSFLETHMAPDSYELFTSFQELVVKSMKQKNSETPDNDVEAASKLNEMLPKIKAGAINYKKTKSNES